MLAKFKTVAESRTKHLTYRVWYSHEIILSIVAFEAGGTMKTIFWSFEAKVVHFKKYQEG